MNPEQNRKLESVILGVVRELNDQLDDKIPVNRGLEAALYGGDGTLDSLGLVTLIVEVEQAIQDAFQVSVTLADEDAVSQERSPFRTIGSLVEYAGALVDRGA